MWEREGEKERGIVVGERGVRGREGERYSRGRERGERERSIVMGERGVEERWEGEWGE